MVISARLIKHQDNDDDNVITPVTEQAVDEKNSGEESELNHLQKLLLDAQKNAQSAKAMADEAMTRVYQENRASRKRAETLAKAFDEAMVSAIEKTQNADSSGSPLKAGKPKLLRKFLNSNSNPLSTLSDLSKSLLRHESTDSEIRREFYNVVIQQSKQLHLLIEDVAEELARKKTEKIAERAKNEIMNARMVIVQSEKEVQAARTEAKKAKGAAEEAMHAAHEQIKNAKAEIEKANTDTAEAIKLAKESIKQAQDDAKAKEKTAELLVSQARNEATIKVAEDIKAARNDVQAAKEAADKAIQQSAIEIEKSRAEIQTAHNNAEVVTALAQDKVRKANEELQEIKQQSKIAVEQAETEARKAKEELETLLAEKEEAIAAAIEESRLTKADAEIAVDIAEKARAKAEEQAYERFREEITRITEELEQTKSETLTAIAGAREESRRAKEEVELVRKESEQAIIQAREESRIAIEEAELAKQKAIKEAELARLELKTVKEEAERKILQANQAIAKASDDIISQAREEIARTRKEIESAGQYTKAIKQEGVNKENSKKTDTHQIAAILHEMRSPLHSISGFARLMLEDDDATTRTEFLSILVQQSDALNELLDSLTNHLNGETDAFEIKKAAVSPDKLITEVIHSMRDEALQKNILLGSTIPESIPAVEADELRIKEVLQNIIDNAVKYNNGDSTVIIKTETAGDDLLIIVEDHGIGIPEDETYVIFDKYYRASNHGDREGQGLGLNICKEIIEKHGGNIRVESIEGEGSKFSFSLPLATV